MVSLVQSMGADHPGTPVLVMSNVTDAAGLAKAQGYGIATAAVDHRPFGKDRAGFEAVLHDHLIQAKVDVICTAGFMRILTPAFIEKWAGKILNIHPSLLPKYKGLHPHARALEAGDSEAGCSVHLMTAEMDGGPVLGQSRVPVNVGDTPDDLAARVLVAEHQLYPQVLLQFLQNRTADE